MTNDYHRPVMLTETIDGLCIRPDGTYVDVTFGGGGHSRALLERLGPEGRLFAFDQDEDARANALDDSRFTLIGENFRHMKSFLRLHGVRQVDGILADLGVSSHQFDVAERGFSTRMDGELDLRMDRRNPVTARDLVNTLEEEDLASLLKNYGELPNARQMARAIVRYREEKSIGTTMELREAVRRHLPRGMENKYLAMLFQALRIEVNGELESLKEMLCQSAEILVEGGRLAVISYHSLEDRLVKNFMRSGNFEGVVEKDFYGNPLSPMRQVIKCAASEAEVAENNRARSARLRVAEKIKN
ncbi:MAG: 16S rRNA (cytosine(1402)-N(4))-methyltransferase RsmH [Bacteroidales bacterium]|nr:16S rRNA (cytosine(1402)-N(4))-methyltransferase RsmH [Bacteroidales bacterium]